MSDLTQLKYLRCDHCGFDLFHKVIAKIKNPDTPYVECNCGRRYQPTNRTWLDLGNAK